MKGRSNRKAVASTPQESNDALPLQIPRLLSRQQAAAYCSVNLETFDVYRRRAIVPDPIIVNFSHRRADLIGRRDIRPDEESVSVVPAGRLGARFARLALNVDDCDVGPLPGENFRRRAAHAFRAAGDHRILTLESTVRHARFPRLRDVVPLIVPADHNAAALDQPGRQWVGEF